MILMTKIAIFIELSNHLLSLLSMIMMSKISIFVPQVVKPSPFYHHDDKDYHFSLSSCQAISLIQLWWQRFCQTISFLWSWWQRLPFFSSCQTISFLMPKITFSYLPPSWVCRPSHWICGSSTGLRGACPHNRRLKKESINNCCSVIIVKWRHLLLFW